VKQRSAHVRVPKRQIPLATPGEILLEEFLKPLGVTQYRLAKEIGVPQRRIGEIVAGKRSITADTAARLGVYFGMEAEFWLNLQAHYDLAITREALAENLAAIQPLAGQRKGVSVLSCPPPFVSPEVPLIAATGPTAKLPTQADS
jgi:addiction module HigA family antidote